MDDQGCATDHADYIMVSMNALCVNLSPLLLQYIFSSFQQQQSLFQSQFPLPCQPQRGPRGQSQPGYPVPSLPVHPMKKWWSLSCQSKHSQHSHSHSHSHSNKILNLHPKRQNRSRRRPAPL